MRYPLALATFASIFLAGCIFDYHEERLAGPYSLVSTDTEDQLRVCYRLTHNTCADRIGPTVVMAGANERYIVACRRRYNDKQDRPTGEEQFFYIDRRADGPSVDVGVSTRGPFSRTEFVSLDAQLGFPTMHTMHG